MQPLQIQLSYSSVNDCIYARRLHPGLQKIGKYPVFLFALLLV